MHQKHYLRKNRSSADLLSQADTTKGLSHKSLSATAPFFWRTTGEKQTNQLINQFEQTLEDDSDEETDVEEEQTSISKEDEAILEEGGIIGIIEIPSIDIRYPVMEGTGVAVLNAGIGHIPETARIGESGNCVLCGHNGSRYGTFFTPLNQISMCRGNGRWIETV